jgi:hypothetical protein
MESVLVAVDLLSDGLVDASLPHVPLNAKPLAVKLLAFDEAVIPLAAMLTPAPAAIPKPFSEEQGPRGITAHKEALGGEEKSLLRRRDESLPSQRPPATAHCLGPIVLAWAYFTAIVAAVSAWISPFCPIAGEKENTPGATFTGT